MIMILSYLRFSISKSSWIPVPNAVIIVLISSLFIMRSIRAFSTFRILPRSGRMACVARVLAFFAEPPAESPSTINISHFLGSLSEQSANFPGRAATDKAVLRVASLAFLAALRARAANTAFSQIVLATLGFCSRK